MSAPETLALKRRVDETIAQIRQLRRTRPVPFYELGTLLISLRDPKIWHLYAETSFRHFLTQQVMPYSTALRAIVVVEDLPEALATSLGLERAFQLTRLVRLDPDMKQSAAELWESNPELGDPPKPLQSMSSIDLAAVVEQVLVRIGQSRAPQPTEKEKAAVARLTARMRERFGPDVKVQLDMKKRVVQFEMDLETWEAHRPRRPEEEEE